MENYYNTLGVAENASQDEIKRAYRKLAMELHPDKNQDNPSAEEKFKKVNEAYSAVGDPDARAKYDQMRQFGGNPGMHGGPFNQGGFEFNFNFGGDINDIFTQVFSGGFGRPNRNRDFNFDLHINLEEAFTGKQTPVQFNVNGQDFNLMVNIPAGIEHGSRVRYQGYGDKSVPNAPPGDLYVSIHIAEHPVFKRQGPHLHAEIEVDALNAIVGCIKEVKCIDGNKIHISIPQGTQPGASLRFKERGMPSTINGHPRGDFITHVKITIPTQLSEPDKVAIRSIASKLPT